MQRLTPLAPFLLFALALALRLWGIGWALPNADRWFSYHPDESVVVTHSLKCYPHLFLLDPGFYNYGSLTLLLNGFFIHLGEMLGVVQEGPAKLVPSASALLTARLLTALLGSGATLFLYFTGKRLYGLWAGVMAALFWAIAPLPVQHSHFATVDVPATFWICGTLFFCAKLLTDTTPTAKTVALAGLFAGLSAATKYNAGLVLLAVWVAVGLAVFPQAPTLRHKGKYLALATGAALLGFLLGCPAVLLNPQGVLAAISYESVHVREGHGAVFAGTEPAFLYHWLVNLRWALGDSIWVVSVLPIFGLILACWERWSSDKILLAFLVPYYLLISFAEVKFARYLLPILPIFFLFMGRIYTWGEKKIQNLNSVKNPSLMAAKKWVATALVVSTMLYMTWILNTAFTQPDVRDQAAAYIRTSGAKNVGFPAGPWFYSPTLHPRLSHYAPPLAKEAATQATNPTLIPADGEWSMEQLQSTNPDAITMTDLNGYGDALRAKDEKARAYIDAVKQRYLKVKVFGSDLNANGSVFAPFRTDYPELGIPRLPHDMLYPCPTVVVFTR